MYFVAVQKKWLQQYSKKTVNRTDIQNVKKQGNNKWQNYRYCIKIRKHNNKMGLCKKQKKVRPPLKPRQGPYMKVNAYTSRPSLQQIGTFVLALLVIILHSIFIVKPITKIDNPILYILLALNYGLVVGLIITYAQITAFDPVDSYIINPDLAQAQANYQNPAYCNLCRSFVHEKSYHCKRCNRCTQDFDHHCAFLNNCIGSLNYQLFMRLLLLYILFLIINIAQCIWVFVRARQNQQIQKASITQWLAIVIIILCVLQLIATIALLGFHCYISCCLDLTTIAFYQSQTQSSHGGDPYNYNRETKRTSSGDVILDIDNSPANLAGKDDHGTNNVLAGHII